MNKIILTDDSSNTLYSETFKEHYHSTNGAINESMHVFIQSGLHYLTLKFVNILEVGFGTGLNAFLTFVNAQELNIDVNYTTIEQYPVDIEIINKLNYTNLISEENQKKFQLIHACPWNEEIQIASNFKITKELIDLKKYEFPRNYFNLIYFDAFSPETQPELWTQSIFTKLYLSLKKGGILTTYSSKGIVKNNLREAGFSVKRLKGPIGKRHILRATKS